MSAAVVQTCFKNFTFTTDRLSGQSPNFPENYPEIFVLVGYLCFISTLTQWTEQPRNFPIPGPHAASYLMGTGGAVPRRKAAGA